MEKAYDLKALGEALKAEGVPVALDALESIAAKAYVATKKWVQESAKLSENKVDDVVAPFLDYVDPYVMPQIDKINGKVG